MRSIASKNLFRWYCDTKYDYLSRGLIYSIWISKQNQNYDSISNEIRFHIRWYSMHERSIMWEWKIKREFSIKRHRIIALYGEKNCGYFLWKFFDNKWRRIIYDNSNSRNYKIIYETIYLMKNTSRYNTLWPSEESNLVRFMIFHSKIT